MEVLSWIYATVKCTVIQKLQGFVSINLVRKVSEKFKLFLMHQGREAKQFKTIRYGTL